MRASDRSVGLARCFGMQNRALPLRATASRCLTLEGLVIRSLAGKRNGTSRGCAHLRICSDARTRGFVSDPELTLQVKREPSRWGRAWRRFEAPERAAPPPRRRDTAPV